MDVVGDRDFSINMISKSGTTTEPAIAFRVFKRAVGEEVRQGGSGEEDLCYNGQGKGERLRTWRQRKDTRHS